jgi:hypothetical protein
MGLVINKSNMKTVRRIITHPLFIILIFCGVLISGEAMGGFYLLYILLGLPYFAFHSIAGIIGIVCLFFSYYSKKGTQPVLNIVGAICITASLVYFFLQPTGEYNYNTFSQFLPLLTVILFVIFLLIFIISNASLLSKKVNKKH